ncbi:MAG: Hint domain-containing protein, partial [Verrucomicrobiia bacterium]
MRAALRIVLLTVLVATTPAFGRGGGGCFEEGTPVLTPTGEVPIEQLRVGDTVIGGRVAAITRVEPLEYLEVARGVHVTAEHPFQIAPGIFRTAERVFPDARRVEAHRPAYNLLVSPGGTFVAAGFVVHNKGCFLPDTPILRADGTHVAISAVRVGDKLLAFDDSGAIVTATVRNVLTHDVEEYLVVRTDQIELRVTAEHPFYVGDGTFKTLEALRIGDAIYAVVARASRPFAVEA